MDKLFIDTCVFEKSKFNFDKRNILIDALINNARDKKFSYQILSVIDGEIINHINQKSEVRYNRLYKDYKWIKDYVSDSDVRDNCYKDLKDYEEFKVSINGEKCDVSSINPERIFNDYFDLKPPFEKKENKRYEFPDAFIVKYVNDLLFEQEKIHFITCDKGLQKALDKSINVYSSIDEFLTKINKVSTVKYTELKSFIKNNLSKISSKVLENLELSYAFLEEEDINIDSLELSDDFSLNVIDIKDDTYYINCTFNEMILNGTFSCLDYDNSYMPYEDEYYVYKEYLIAHNIIFPNFRVSLKLISNKSSYKIIYDESYYASLSYDQISCFSDGTYGPYDDYDGEDSWTQDGGPWR